MRRPTASPRTGASRYSSRGLIERQGRGMFAQLFRSDLSKNLFRLALWGAGLASISMMIWTLGPLIDIGGYRPFENYLDRKSTRLNSSHQIISYAVFCLKKKKK